MSRNRDNEAFPKILRDRAQGRARSHTESRGTDVVETIARRMAEAEAKRRAGGKLGSAKDSVVAVAGRSFGESHEKRVNTLLPKAMAYLRQGLTEAELAEVIKAFDFENDRLPDWPGRSVKKAAGNLASTLSAFGSGAVEAAISRLPSKTGGNKVGEIVPDFNKALQIVQDYDPKNPGSRQLDAEFKAHTGYSLVRMWNDADSTLRLEIKAEKFKTGKNRLPSKDEVRERMVTGFVLNPREAYPSLQTLVSEQIGRREAARQQQEAQVAQSTAAAAAQQGIADAQRQPNGLHDRSAAAPQQAPIGVEADLQRQGAEALERLRQGLSARQQTTSITPSTPEWQIAEPLVRGNIQEYLMQPDGGDYTPINRITSFFAQQGYAPDFIDDVVGSIINARGQKPLDQAKAAAAVADIMQGNHLVSQLQPAAGTPRMTTVAMPIASVERRQAASPQPQALHPQAEQALRAAAGAYPHSQAQNQDNGVKDRIMTVLGQQGISGNDAEQVYAQFERTVSSRETAADALVEAVQTYRPAINSPLESGVPMADRIAPNGSIIQTATSVAGRMASKVIDPNKVTALKDKAGRTVTAIAGVMPKSDVLRDARKKAHKLVADKLGEGLAKELGFHLRRPQNIQTVIDALVDHVNKVEGPHGITEPGYTPRTSDVVTGMRDDPEFAAKVQKILENGKGDSKRNIARLTDEIVKRVVSQYELSDSSKRFDDRFSAPKTYPSYQDDALKSFKANKAEIEAQAAKAKAEADHRAALDAAQKEAAAARAEAEAQAQAAAEKQAAEAEADRLAAEAEAAKAAEQPSQAKPDAAAATAEAERQQAEQVAKESEKAEEFAVRAVNALRGGTAPEPLVKGKTSTELREETFAAFGNYVSTLRAEIDELESIRHSFMRGYVTSMVVKNAQSFEDIETIDALIESKRAELAKAAGQEAADKSKPKEVDPDDKDLVW